MFIFLSYQKFFNLGFKRKTNRIVEKLILYRFSLYGNGRLKRFVNRHYGIFQQPYYIVLSSFRFALKL
ncbi:hypothetical protein B0192_10175 [Leptospira interrogans serovar Australis]|nr:hypothetical protein B0192_10175 [Leptospira interrogans serovar Australis]